jgi:hypothetical protein
MNVEMYVKDNVMDLRVLNSVIVSCLFKLNIIHIFIGKNNSSRKNHTGLNCTAICQSSKFWTDNSDNNFVKSYSGFI